MLFISNEFCDLGITRVRDGELTAESQQQASKQAILKDSSQFLITLARSLGWERQVINPAKNLRRRVSQSFSADCFSTPSTKTAQLLLSIILEIARKARAPLIVLEKWKRSTVWVSQSPWPGVVSTYKQRRTEVKGDSMCMLQKGTVYWRCLQTTRKPGSKIFLPGHILAWIS